MISYREALDLILASAAKKSLEIDSCDLRKASGRILARDVSAESPLPGFRNSSMDGFAVRTQDLGPGVNRLRVSGVQMAGRMVSGAGVPGEALRIMTGAPLPEGWDAVVKIEDCTLAENVGETVVSFDRSYAEEDFVREIGEDLQAGQLLGSAGRWVDSRMVMGLSACGVSKVPVFRKPRALLVSTGSELIEPEHTPAPGEVRNATAPYLEAELVHMGVEVRNWGILRDEQGPQELLKVLSAATLESFDLVILTGAVSMGMHDFVPATVQCGGGRILFHRVAVRPGKPILFAEIDSLRGPVVFGLPGNPISTAVGLEFFLKPYLRALLQMAPVRFERARLLQDVEKPKDFRVFLRGLWEQGKDGILQVGILPGQASFRIGSFCDANAWVILSESSEGKRGDWVEVLRMGEAI